MRKAKILELSCTKLSNVSATSPEYMPEPIKPLNAVLLLSAPDGSPISISPIFDMIPNSILI
ncbi:hypothetical protein O181_005878, partial [Austropuccinia psidii MF-1]|nr:hypothetical protein [Austropuccinia psidii MF-1]